MTKLTPDKKTSYTVALFTLIALLSTLAIDARYARWAAVAVLLVSAALVLSFVKKRSIHSYHKRDVLLLMIVSSLLYLVIYYLSGLYFEFGSTLIKLSLETLLRYILPIAATILLSEYVRAVLLGQQNRLVTLIIYFVGVISEVLIAGGVVGIDSSYELADFIGITLLPAITANLLYNYTSKRYGMLPNLVYRIILTLYYYLIPFVPNAPPILTAFALLLLPLLVLTFIDAMYEKKVKRAKERRSRLSFVFPVVVIAILSAFTMLVSCQFRYGILVIASPSMADEINVGDAVVFEDFEDYGEVKENDIIVFTKDGKTRYVHRVIAVNTINGQKQYTTKGDANENPEPGFVTDGQIVGVVHFKVLYIGYPSLWLREIFK